MISPELQKSFEIAIENSFKIFGSENFKFSENVFLEYLFSNIKILSWASFKEIPRIFHFLLL